MKKAIITILLIIFLLAYLFLFLGIELELKFNLEHFAYLHERLIDISFEIRKLATIQLILFIIIFGFCIYIIYSKKERNEEGALAPKIFVAK